ncbi:MAG: hypothetical protein PHC61_15210 [Chitinivibrionales bacterium]|nr:hypothetical protein [Chitinivibrionales bacterium]
MFSVLWHRAIESLALGIATGLVDSLGMWLSTRLAGKSSGRSAQLIMTFSSIGRLLFLGCIILIIAKQHTVSLSWFIAGLLPITLGKFIIVAGTLKKSWKTVPKQSI